MPTGDRRRAAAKCRSCGRMLAAHIWTDGTIKTIGRKGCPCGEADLAECDLRYDHERWR